MALSASSLPFRSAASAGVTLKKEFLQTGMAGYSFVNYTIDQTIAIMNRVGISNLSVKDFHLPLNSSRQTIDEVLARFRDGGIHIYLL